MFGLPHFLQLHLPSGGASSAAVERRRRGIALLAVTTMVYQGLSAVLAWSLGHPIMTGVNVLGVVMAGVLGYWAWVRALNLKTLGRWVVPLACAWLALMLVMEWTHGNGFSESGSTQLMLVVLACSLLNVRPAALVAGVSFLFLVGFSLQPAMPVPSIQRLVDAGFLNLLILGLTVFGQRVIEAEQVASTHALLAIRDPLTGLYNRRAVDFLLREIEQGVLHPPGSTAVALIDIDHFKQVNDVYGHETGDDVLRALARVIQEHLREREMGIRWGGEEIMLVLLNVTPQEAYRRLNALRLAVSRVGVAREKPLRFTVSVGLGMLSEVEALSDIFGVIDARMYQAKAQGRNRVVAVGQGHEELLSR